MHGVLVLFLSPHASRVCDADGRFRAVLMFVLFLLS